MSKPYLFDEFFASGQEESISPFLTASSRNWGKNISLKSAVASAILLCLAFIFSFVHPAASQLLLITVYVLAGTPALIHSLEDLKNLEINIDVLMTLAALLSVVIGSAFEGALLLVLFELSGAMEETVSQKTKGALVHLNRLAPRTACVIAEEGTLYEQSVKDIPLGTLILIKAGEIVPLDGKVVEGNSFVNLVHLTGESVPVPKKPGDEIPAGAKNLDGYLHVQITRTSSDSTLSRIIQLITQAQAAKPKLEKFLDTFGKWYAIGIIFLSVIFAVTIPYIFSVGFFGPGGGIYRALTFLIAASPCALIIATPTAYLSAINSCARKGILLKGGVILDALAKCKIVAFDKTGTLTTGKLVCAGMTPLTSAPTDAANHFALSVAAALERHAVHPISEAICAFAREKNAAPIPLEHFKATAGSGLEGLAQIGDEKVWAFIGHPLFIASKLPEHLLSRWQAIHQKMEDHAHINTILLVGDALYSFHFSESLRPETIGMVESMREKNRMRLMILTGDHSQNALKVAAQLGIDEIFTNLRPEDKLDKVAHFSQSEGLMMVGDGINDAPALARATVGVSMGKIGSAAAVDVSDIVFLKDDLSLLSWLKDKSLKTASIVKQNLFLALGVILFATTPALMGSIPLWAAVILHEGGTVLVGLNSLRLLRR